MTTSVSVRFSAALAQAAGTPRLQLVLPGSATVGDLLDRLAAEQPALANRLSHLVVAVAGRHVGRDEPLQDGQEVVLVMPAAGGAHAQPALPTISPTGGSAW
jgi:molybdopterin converting factor small subunit